MFKIKQFREREGMSQSDLAKRVGVSAAAVCKWESGSSSPTFWNLLTMAKLFGCTIDDLLDRHTVAG